MSRRSPRRAYDENGREILPPTIDMLRAEADRTAVISCHGWSSSLPAHHKVVGRDAPWSDEER
ncbi:hypothetical protein [Methylobacterium nodulans]|uniref:Uncharacterized protein n=1 Tax=Methylobacterium nodulans (strain LMG 21967 / CNCM I-2342 / ORS 2060) TaxID=460265 RepID=B8ISI4_METNO|nr:hypothetical protein [Methylobacterium nodulans]ACL58824.1 hypothetical protein Mnod_3924 [Methylobacterium nodulans ORS 2060]